MLMIYLFLLLCIFDLKGEKLEGKRTDSQTRTNVSETIKLRVNFNFTRHHSDEVTGKLTENVKIKCDSIFNITKAEQHIKEVPDHVFNNLLNYVQVKWYKGKSQANESNKYHIKKYINIPYLNTTLTIRNLTRDDEGVYTCVLRHTNNEKSHNIGLIVEDNHFDLPVIVSNNFTANGSSKVNENDATKKIEPFEPVCQKYNGSVCNSYLKNQYVYVPINSKMITLEEKLSVAAGVIKYSNDLSSNCDDYALPSLCFSTFPICRYHEKTNKFFFDYVKENEIHLKVSTLDEIYNSHIKKLLDPKVNNTIVRKVCKTDCQILENELCHKEYAIAKSHPLIGQRLELVECVDLPDNDEECLKIGIKTVMVSDDKCYWENGVHYTGKVNTSIDGEPCILWHKQLYVRPADYNELAGLHNYCRNPGGIEPQPWCYILKNGQNVKAACEIPKCAYEIWLYIIFGFVGLLLLFIMMAICICYRSRNKDHSTNIRNINLPNADTNIYGKSRHNSEMSELLVGNNQSQDGGRGNGIMRVPHYKLSQIKFLEELGEGAFGKVYKGAITKGSDTIYVAVKALKENASAKTKADFRREIELISDLKHDNIVCIVGIALQEEPLCMLFEFMARGDLHEFLMGRAPPAGKGLPTHRLINIAYNIACGMQYLASHHYVHRDLAARNCLVSDDFIVKISDFGLSRDIYSSDYYRVQSKSLLPVRWMPPESILYGKFTTESDIWSYGVVLWEIYSFGLQPYYGYSNQEVINMVRGGDLLACPTNCPSCMYCLMKECWRHTPQKRPSFDEIVNRLSSWVNNGICSDSTTENGSVYNINRQTIAFGETKEKAPLLPPYGSSSNSLRTSSLKKVQINKATDDCRSTCSEIAPHLIRKKKGSCASLETDRGTCDTVIRMRTNSHGNEI